MVVKMLKLATNSVAVKFLSCSAPVFPAGVEDGGCIAGEELHDKGTFLVFLNGELLGVHRRPRQFLASFRSLRRLGKVRFAWIF